MPIGRGVFNFLFPDPVQQCTWPSRQIRVAPILLPRGLFLTAIQLLRSNRSSLSVSVPFLRDSGFGLWVVVSLLLFILSTGIYWFKRAYIPFFYKFSHDVVGSSLSCYNPGGCASRTGSRGRVFGNSSATAIPGGSGVGRPLKPATFG
ncbi:hypothetical protein BD779DRAFT_1469165 [Infundibulicybe gibba]|nr:hypothetical protein BD779DRAFT_1469165 [Infundibulicybe gibba]